jgi:hypothetical protein
MDNVMVLDRRQMLTLTAKGAMAATLLGSVAEMEGCNAQQWIATALADLPAILQVITSIVGIVAAAKGGAVPQAVLDTVNRLGGEAKTDLQLAQTLVTQYQTAAASAKPDLLSKIDVALNDGLGSLQGILTAFHVNDTTLEATIAAALGSAITVVLAIQALIPAPPAATSSRKALGSSSNQSPAIKQAFNLIIGKAYPNAII